MLRLQLTRGPLAPGGDEDGALDRVADPSVCCDGWARSRPTGMLSLTCLTCSWRRATIAVMEHNAHQTIDRREVNRRGLLALGVGVTGAMLGAAEASGLLPEKEAEASGNFVAAKVVSSEGDVLVVERVDNQERLTVVTDSSTRIPDRAIGQGRGQGRIVGINAPGVGDARAASTVRATVVAPCVLGLRSEAQKRQNVAP